MSGLRATNHSGGGRLGAGEGLIAREIREQRERELQLAKQRQQVAVTSSVETVDGQTRESTTFATRPDQVRRVWVLLARTADML